MRLPAKIAAIHIQGDEVRAALVKTGLRSPQVLELRAARAAYSEPAARAEALSEAVAEVRRQVKGKPAAWVLCAPSASGVARQIAMQLKGRRRVAAAVPFELEPYLAVPIEDLVVDHNVIRESGTTTDVLAVGMKRTVLEEQLGILRGAGIEAEGIALDVGAVSALWHQRRGGKSPGLHAQVHVLDHGAVLAIVRDKALAFFRLLGFDGAGLNEAPEAAAREVQNSLRAFLAQWQGGEDVQTITVTGADLDEPGRLAFESAFLVPVTFERLLEGIKGAGAAALAKASETLAPSAAMPDDPFEHPPVERPLEAQWAPAIGAALTAAGGPFAFNFRTGDLAPPNMTKVLIRHAVFSGSLALVALGGYLTYCYVGYRQNEAAIERIGEQIWESYRTAFPNHDVAQDGRRPSGDRGGMRSFEFMQAAYDEFAESHGPSGVLTPELFQQPKFLDVLKEVAGKMPENMVSITNITVKPTRQGRDVRTLMTISGKVGNDAAFNQAFEALRASEMFTVEDEPSRLFKDNETIFEIDVLL